MNIDDLRLFVDVVQEGSFAAVARRSNLAPSTVSRSIGALERELGLRLFQRTSRKLALTEAGTIYYERLRNVLDELSRAHEETIEITGSAVGNLRVTASVAFGHALLVPLLPAWRSAYPAIALDLMLTDAQVDLIGERVDIAVRFGVRPDLRMVGSKLLLSRYRVCASPSYLKHASPLLQPHQLADHDCVVFRWQASHSLWQFRDATGVVSNVNVGGSIMISSALSVRQAAIDGLGPALLPDWLIATELASGILIDVFPAHEVTATGFDTAAWLLYPSKTYLPLKTRAFIDFLKSHIGHVAAMRNRAHAPSTRQIHSSANNRSAEKPPIGSFDARADAGQIDLT